MARASTSSTKFASVNLNKSYGKPAPSQGAPLPGAGSARSRISPHGGMLLLTRPVRSQPAALAVQKGAKLTVPRPVNLPSLRREHAGNDPTIALVGGTGASGWPKQEQKEVEEVAGVSVAGDGNAVAVSGRSTSALSAGCTWGGFGPPPTLQASGHHPVHAAVSNAELRPSLEQQAVARSGVYTPPRARLGHANAAPPPSAPAVEKAVLLRGEDFPTLQAAVPPPPAPPQQRQKELQLKQREKQQELKEQQQRLQQLSQKHPVEEPAQPQAVVPQLQPSQPVSLQPKREQPPQSFLKESAPSRERLILGPGPAASNLGPKPDEFSHGTQPTVSVNHISNWTDDEREPAPSFRPQGGQGIYNERSVRREGDHFLEDSRRSSRGDDFGYGRVSSQRDVPSFGTAVREGGPRDTSFGRDAETGREGSFSTDAGYGRENNPHSEYVAENNFGFHRDGGYGRERPGSRDGGFGREGGFPRDWGYGKDANHAREHGMGREAGHGRDGYGRQGGEVGREFGSGRENNLDRHNYGRVGAPIRDLAHEREGLSFNDGYFKDGGSREVFHRDSSTHARDANFHRDGPYGRDNRRVQGGEFGGGGRGRFGERFGKSGSGRFDGAPDFTASKGAVFSCRGTVTLDPSITLNRERRFGMSFVDDPFVKDYPDIAVLNFRSSPGLGIEPLTVGLGLDSKLSRRKKEEVKTDFHDPERESFEAELEREQKLQEQDRLRKIEEKERAIEIARKEQEEQERLAREEEEHRLKLEQEARDAIIRAEHEAREAASKLEEDRRAREEEKRAIILEEERRKENARRKLLELEEKIAKREAERKQREEGPRQAEDRPRLSNHSQVDDVVKGREDAEREEDERIVASLTGADQDDDERAPLRSSGRPASPFTSRAPQDDLYSRNKSPEGHNQSTTGRGFTDFRGSNSFEADRPRSFLPWRRDSVENGNGSSQIYSYARDDSADFQLGMPPRDRLYNSRGFVDRETYYGSPNSVLSAEAGHGEFSLRKDRIPAFQERKWTSNDETILSNKHSVSPRATTPESDGGYMDGADRDDRHWGRNKFDRRKIREGQRLSPPLPSSYLPAFDVLESSSFGRLRHSMPKQPRVPPLPVRASLQRPPLKVGREQPGSTPSTLLHTGGDDTRDTSWQLESLVQNHTCYLDQSGRKGQLIIDPTDPSQHAEGLSGQRESSSSPLEKAQTKDWQIAQASLRSQHSFIEGSKGQGEVQGSSKSERQQSSESEDRSFDDSPTDNVQTSQFELEDRDSEVETIPALVDGKLVVPDGKLVAEDVGYEEDEEDDCGGREEEEDEDEDEEGGEEFDDEEDVVGEWEDEVDHEQDKVEDAEDSAAMDYTTDDLGQGNMDDADDEEEEEEIEHRGECQLQEGHIEAEQGVDFSEESSTSRQQENSLQHSTGQAFGHSSLAPSSDLEALSHSVLGDTHDAKTPLSSSAQQVLSFMSLPVSQPHGTSQLPSLMQPPLVQTSHDSHLTLHFGLLPSTSLSGALPAIQIGSIQMPLHLHTQGGSQCVPLSQTPSFQFGQLGNQTSSPAFVQQSSSVSQSFVHSLTTDLQYSGTQLSGTVGQSGTGLLAPEVRQNDLYSYKGDESSTQLSRSVLPSQGVHVSVDEKPCAEYESGDLNSSSSKNISITERRGRDVEQATKPPTKTNSRDQPRERLGTDGHSHSMGSFLQNNAATPSEGSLESSQTGDYWQRSYSGGRGRNNPSRWTSSGRGRGRNGSVYGGRGSFQSSLDSSSFSSGNYVTEGGPDGVRTRPTRRNSYQRSEFKTREPSLPLEKGFGEASGAGKQSFSRDKYSHLSGWQDPSGNTGEISFSRDRQNDSTGQLYERKGAGEISQSLRLPSGRSGQNRVERPSGGEIAHKTGRSSANSRPGEGLLGKYSSDVIDAPLQSGVVHVFEQPGIDGPSDEDDFIEVRSKRQMLNDRREQREKEIKAKSKDLKAKEQAARKQRNTAKTGFQGELAGTGKTAGIVGVEKRATNTVVGVEASTNHHRLVQGNSITAVPSVSTAVATSPGQLLSPIGTPAGGLVDSQFEKRSKTTKPTRINDSAKGFVEEEQSVVSVYDNQDGLSSTPLAWGRTRSTLQVVSLTQIQLEEAMKPVRFEAPIPQQLPLGERGSMVLESGTSVASMAAKEKACTPASGPVSSLLAGEKIQFGAVTSSPIAMTSTRPLTPGLNAVVGSSLVSRADGTAEDNEMKTKSKRFSGPDNEVISFSAKGKRTRGHDERVGEAVDSEAEAESSLDFASTVAVAAISSDESVGSSHHNNVQNLPLRGLSGSGNKSSYGNTSVTSSHSEYWPVDTGMAIGDPNLVIQSPMLEESMSVALPADLSVEPTTMSIRGPMPNASGLLLPLPGGPLPFRGLEMGTMLGGSMFGFGPPKDSSQGSQGSNSGSVHEQGISNTVPGSGGWQPQHSGGVDSYYAGPPPSGYAGTFINPTGGLPSIQGSPHMLVYTSPFASVSQFGQLGVGFVSPQQYLSSRKLPDWKHTPVSSSGPGVVGMGSGEVGGGLGGIMSGQRGSGVTNNVQRIAPGPAVISAPGPFDLNLSASFQIPGADVSMQSQWSHVPGPQLHSVSITGPLMGFPLQSRHTRGPAHIGHLPHMMDTTSGFNLAPTSNPMSSGAFQSVDPAAQFPDELGLGDSSSSGTNTSSSFRGQRTSSRAPVSSVTVTPSAGATGGAKQLRSGRRARVARGGSSLGGGGNGNNNSTSLGMVTSSGLSGQGSNGSRAPSPHVQSPAQMPSIPLGQHPHSVSSYSDQRGALQQGLPRLGISGGWPQGHRKGGGPGRPPVADRSSSGDKNFVSSSKLKQVYVVKPSSSPRRNTGEPTSNNLFSGSEVNQTSVGH